MSDQAANDVQASTGSHDDESATSSHALQEAPPNFQQRLAAWLTVYDRKIFLKAKVEEGLQAAGAEPNSPDLIEVVTKRTTADIDEHRAYTSLNDRIQDNDTDGTLAAERDTALQHLDPLLEERNRLIEEVIIRTYNVLQKAATNSSGAADPTYDALKDDRLANDALIRGILASHRAEPDNFKDTRKAATTPLTRAAKQAGHVDPPSTPSPPGFTIPTGHHFQWRRERQCLPLPTRTPRPQMALQRRPNQPYGAYFRFTVWRSRGL